MTFRGVRRVSGCVAGAVAAGALVAGCGSSAPPAAPAPATAAATTPAPTEVLPAPVDDSQPVTVQPTPSATTDASGISGVRAWVTATGAPGALAHTHVNGPVTYAVTPPVGGPHNPVWSNCGVYAAPIPDERAVHDLEHGAVWITYRKGTSDAVVQQLQAFVAEQTDATFTGSAGTLEKNGVTKDTPLASPGRYLLLSPWPDASLPSPIVLSAWGRQLGVDSPADPRMQQFVDAFRTNLDLSYEAGFAPCGGQPVNVSGEPLAS